MDGFELTCAYISNCFYRLSMFTLPSHPLFQWLVVLILLLLANALWMCRRRTRSRIHRISSIRDAQRQVFTNDER